MIKTLEASITEDCPTTFSEIVYPERKCYILNNMICHIGRYGELPEEAKIHAKEFVRHLYAMDGTFFTKEENDTIKRELAEGTSQAEEPNPNDIHVVVIDQENKKPLVCVKLVSPEHKKGDRLDITAFPTGHYAEINENQYPFDSITTRNSFELTRLGTANGQMYKVRSSAITRCLREVGVFTDAEFEFFKRYFPQEEYPAENTLQVIKEWSQQQEPKSRVGNARKVVGKKINAIRRRRPSLFMMAAMVAYFEEYCKNNQIDNIFMFATIVAKGAGNYLSRAGIETKEMQISKFKEKNPSYERISTFFDRNKGNIHAIWFDFRNAQNGMLFNTFRHIFRIPGRVELQSIHTEP